MAIALFLMLHLTYSRNVCVCVWLTIPHSLRQLSWKTTVILICINQTSWNFQQTNKLLGLIPRTIPTERQPLVREVSANFWGQRSVA
jgi:hypothetical protein